MEFTLSLALFDFVPVFLTGIGFLYLARLVLSVLPAQGRIAFLGGLLVVAGGFFRATWKLLMALSHGALDVNWMEESLFILMAPGYILFTWSVWQVSRSVRGKKAFHAWLFPLALVLILFAASYLLFISQPDAPAWKRLLLSVTVLANTILAILLIVFAFRQKLSTAAWLFILNLIGIFIMNGLARLPEQPIHIHWIAEAINTVSWLSFAFASLMVYRYARANFSGETSSLQFAAMIESQR